MHAHDAHGGLAAAFLLTKPRPRIVGQTCCNERTTVARMAGHTAHAAGSREISTGRCTRPVWGDGTVDKQYHGLCSQCYHEWAAFHSHYVLMQANPAAAALSAGGKLDATAIERLCFNGAELPAEAPLFIPADWV